MQKKKKINDPEKPVSKIQKENNKLVFESREVVA
jgi:hypothetical protein